MSGALTPIMTPTHNDITSIWSMAMVTEISTLKLELNADPLPFTGANLALSLAVWKTSLNSFNQITELSRDHTKQKDNAILVYGLMAETPKIDWITICGATV